MRTLCFTSPDLHRVQIFPCKLFFFFLWVLLFVFNFFRISSSSISSESQIFNVFFRLWLFFYGNQVFKTRDLCGILVSNSTNRKWVFKPQVIYGSRVSKTRDTCLLKPFKRVLAYYILSPYYASPQIPSVQAFSHQ